MSEIVFKTAVGEEIVFKYNPYHGARGRFASRERHTLFSLGKDPKTAAESITREKKRMKEQGFGGKSADEWEAQAGQPGKAAPETLIFQAAKTVKGAETYAMLELGFQKENFRGLGLEVANHVNEQITAIQRKFPELKGVVSEIGKCKSDAYAQVSTFADGKMLLELGSETYGKGLKYVEKTFENDVKQGFHPPNTDYKSLLWHEYGHIIASFESKNKGRGMLRFIEDRKSGGTESSWIKSAANKLGLRPSDMMNRISKYAQTNSKEAFAEAFAEVMCSKKPRAESVAVVKESGYHR